MKVMVTRAVTSDQFRKGMMNGRRAELIREYDLDPDEQAEIMAIRANTEAEFYGAMDRIIVSREPRHSLLLADRYARIDRGLGAFAQHAVSRLSVPA
jgi:hypothetical protein